MWYSIQDHKVWGLPWTMCKKQCHILGELTASLQTATICKSLLEFDLVLCPFLLHIGVLSCLSLCWSWIYCFSLHINKCICPVVSEKRSFVKNHSWSLALVIFPFPLPHKSLSVKWRGVIKTSHSRPSIPKYSSLFVLYSYRSLC